MGKEMLVVAKFKEETVNLKNLRDLCNLQESIYESKRQLGSRVLGPVDKQSIFFVLEGTNQNYNQVNQSPDSQSSKRH